MCVVKANRVGNARLAMAENIGDAVVHFAIPELMAPIRCHHVDDNAPPSKFGE